MKINRISINTFFGGIDISLGHDKKEHLDSLQIQESSLEHDNKKDHDSSKMQLMITLDAIQGDILSQRGFDALVNPTNTKFLPGNHSLDAKVYAAAGEALRQELNKIGFCPAGSAEITQGYLLPYKYIIHVVGRKWTGNDMENVESLEHSY